MVFLLEVTAEILFMKMPYFQEGPCSVAFTESFSKSCNIINILLYFICNNVVFAY